MVGGEWPNGWDGLCDDINMLNMLSVGLSSVKRAYCDKTTGY